MQRHRSISNFVNRFIRDTRGSTAIEMSILLLPLMLFIFGLIEVSRLYYSKHELVMLADKFSRQIILANSPETLLNWQELAVEHSILIDPTKITLVQDLTPINGVVYHRLDLSYEFSYLVPIIGSGVQMLEYARTIPVNGF